MKRASKTGYVLTDSAKLTVDSVSMWENPDKFESVADAPDYQAVLGRSKYTRRNVYVLIIQ
jgi:hypothetical protein